MADKKPKKMHRNRWLNTAVITVFLTAVAGPVALVYAKNQHETKELQTQIMQEMMGTVTKAKLLSDDGAPYPDELLKVVTVAYLVTENRAVIGLDFSTTAKRLDALVDSLMTTKVAELKAIKAEQEEQLRLLLADIATMEESRTVLFQEKKELEDLAIRHGTELERYKDNRRANKRLINSLDGRLTAANQLRVRFENDLDQKETEISEAREDQIRLTNEVALKDEGLGQLRKTLSERTFEIEELSAQLELVRQERTRADDARVSLAEQFKSEQRQRERLTSENRQLKSELESLRNLQSQEPPQPLDTSEGTDSPPAEGSGIH